MLGNSFNVGLSSDSDSIDTLIFNTNRLSNYFHGNSNEDGINGGLCHRLFCEGGGLKT